MRGIPLATKDTSDRLTSNPFILTAVVIGGVLALVCVLAPLVEGWSGEFVVSGRNYLHDAIHAATGLAGLVAGWYAGGTFARQYAVGLGVVYLLVARRGSCSCPRSGACSM